MSMEESLHKITAIGPSFCEDGKVGGRERGISSREYFSGEKVQRGRRLFFGLCYSEGFSDTLFASKSYIFRHLRLMTYSLLQTCLKYIFQ